MVDLNALAGPAGELLHEHGDRVDAAVDKIKDPIPDGDGAQVPAAPAGP